jgi:hypothetical protein
MEFQAHATASQVGQNALPRYQTLCYGRMKFPWEMLDPDRQVNYAVSNALGGVIIREEHFRELRRLSR